MPRAPFFHSNWSFYCFWTFSEFSGPKFNNILLPFSVIFYFASKSMVFIRDQADIYVTLSVGPSVGRSVRRSQKIENQISQLWSLIETRGFREDIKYDKRIDLLMRRRRRMTTTRWRTMTRTTTTSRISQLWD